MTAPWNHLADAWLLLIGFLVLYYAVTDGANLGVGILSLFAGSEEEREQMMHTMTGTWYNTQTWLVLLGGMLFGAFPLFYGLIFSALYLPLVAMLVGLIFRGVSLEFREHARNRRRWSALFGWGSLTAAVCQGAALGGLLGGSLEFQGDRYAGTLWGWATAYGAVICAGLLFGYAMLGASYLILKAEGPVQRKAFRAAWLASLVTLAISLAVHVWTVARYPYIARKWGAFPEVLTVVPAPALAAVAFGLYLRSLKLRQESAPLLWNAVVVVLSFVGLSVDFYPQMIPHVVSSPITVQAAAASSGTLSFMLVVIAVFLPLILVYTAYAHRVFRGKGGAGYGEGSPP